MNNDNYEANNGLQGYFQDLIKSIVEHDKLTAIYKFLYFFIKLAYTLVTTAILVVFVIVKFLIYGNAIAKLILQLIRVYDPITNFFVELSDNYKKHRREHIAKLAEKLKERQEGYRKVHDAINKVLGYALLLLLPVIVIFLLLTKLPPWAKAILSALVWGFGQLLNRQYIKAAIFAGALALVIFIELDTGSYDESFDLYEDRIPGEELPEELTNYWPTWYYYKHIDFMVVKTGIPVNLVPDAETLYTEYEFLDYVADINGYTFDRASFEFLDENNDDVLVDDILLSNEDFYTYISGEILRIEGELAESGTLQSIVDEAEIYADSIVEEKTQEAIRNKAVAEMGADDAYQTNFDAKFDELLEGKLCVGFDPVCPADPEYDDAVTAYLADASKFDQLVKETNDELIQPFIDIITTNEYDVIYGGQEATYRLNSLNFKYKELYGELVFEYDSIRSFKEMLDERISSTGLGIDNDDFNKMLTRIYFGMHEEDFTTLIDYINDFYHERGGFFIRGIWGVVTMGTAQLTTVDEHQELSYFNVSYAGTSYEARDIVLNGHISDKLLLRGIIAVLAMVYVLVIYVWNIRDAFKSGQYLKKNKKAENEGEYFARLYEEMFEYIVLTPALILVTFISVMPILFGLGVAFTNFNIENLPPGKLIDWVGLDNFRQVFSLGGESGIDFGGQFWKVASWTLIWAIAATFTCFFGGFIQAVIINNKRVVFRKMWRSVLILPWAVPALISQMIFRVVFNDNGYVNQILSRTGVTSIFLDLKLLRPYDQAGEGIRRLFYFGEETFQWLSNEANPWFVRIFIIVLNVWLGFPFFMALMSGVMTSIDKSLYEAASIDGATGFQQFRYITMPLVLFATSPLLVMTFSGNFNNFGVIYFITGGGPGGGTVDTAYAGSTDILISWIYKLTTDPNIRWYSMASVFSILIFLIIGTLSAWNFTRTRAFKEGD